MQTMIAHATTGGAFGNPKEIILATEDMTEYEREQIFAHNRANAIKFFGHYLPPLPGVDDR